MTSSSELPYRLTRKQQEVLQVICKGAEGGEDIDLDQLLEKISYETSKASMQFTIRSLIKREMIQKLPKELRRGRKRVLYSATVKGRELLFGGVIIEDLDLGEA